MNHSTMQYFSRFTLAVIVSFLSSGDSVGSESDIPDIFVEPTQAEYQRVTLENDYFIRERSYFARQHRIVKVDHSVLRNSEKIRIALFGGDELLVQRNTLEEEENSLMHWVGQITSPAFPVSDLVRPGRSEGRTKKLHENLVRVALTGVCYDVEESTAHSFPSRSEVNAQGFRRLADGGQITKSAFYSFASEFRDPVSGRRYSLIALEATPEFHLLYELDKNKEFPVGVTLDVEIESLRQNYFDHVESLGRNPKEDWKERHKRNANSEVSR